MKRPRPKTVVAVEARICVVFILSPGATMLPPQPTSQGLTNIELKTPELGGAIGVVEGQSPALGHPVEPRNDFLGRDVARAHIEHVTHFVPNPGAALGAGLDMRISPSTSPAATAANAKPQEVERLPAVIHQARFLFIEGEAVCLNPALEPTTEFGPLTRTGQDDQIIREADHHGAQFAPVVNRVVKRIEVEIRQQGRYHTALGGAPGVWCDSRGP